MFRQALVPTALATDSGERHARTALPRLIGDPFTAAAICLTVIGWSLIWACALGVVPLVPLELPVILFVTGLALIPFRPTPQPKQD